MLNEDISGHLPLKIDVNPAVVVAFFLFFFYYSGCFIKHVSMSMYFSIRTKHIVIWILETDKKKCVARVRVTYLEYRNTEKQISMCLVTVHNNTLINQFDV